MVRRGSGVRVPRRAAALIAFLLPVLGSAACGSGAEFSPAGRVEAAPEEFRWPDWGGAEEYELKIYRPDQTLIFESARIPGSVFPVKPGLRKKLEEAGEFEWWIRGFERGRLAGRSDPVRVVIGSAE
ncbi:MAG: hypothetical protein HKN12_11020 [Gemmatimonadetes bacterium]|nr:hypothetical protein [Gemmatimonadota bacterium]